jgi:hypothetical protein
MMAKRTRASNVVAGKRAYDSRIAQYGPDEQNRAGRQMSWTKENPDRDKSENPHLRDTVYSASEREEATKFAAWAKAHRDKGHSENPHSWLNRTRD